MRSECIRSGCVIIMILSLVVAMSVPPPAVSQGTEAASLIKSAQPTNPARAAK